MSYSNDWVDTIPIDHTKFNATPGAVRQVRVDIEQRLENLFYGFISGEVQTNEGAKSLPYVAQAADPSTPTGKITVYSKYPTTNPNYTFTVTSANATAGAIYSNNGQNYTVLGTISGETTLQSNGSSNPLSSGTLTKVSGTGDSTIAFSSYSFTQFPTELFLIDELGNIIQLTKSGYINAAFLGNLANMAAGLIPQANIPKLDGSGNLVDGAALSGLANVPSGAGIIPIANIPTPSGTRVTKTAGTEYQAATDGYIEATLAVAGNNTTFPSNASVYISGSSPATGGTRHLFGIDGIGTIGGYFTITRYVKKGEYYNLTNINGTGSISMYQFVPTGS